MTILTRVVDYLAAVIDSTDDRKGRYEPGLATFAATRQGRRTRLGLEPLAPATIVAEWDGLTDHQRANWGRKEAASDAQQG